MNYRIAFFMTALAYFLTVLLMAGYQADTWPHETHIYLDGHHVATILDNGETASICHDKDCVKQHWYQGQLDILGLRLRDPHHVIDIRMASGQEKTKNNVDIGTVE